MKSIILDSKTKSSLDSDDVSMFIIQQIVTNILKNVLFIFNMTLKTAKIIPIFKNDDKCDLSYHYIPNYLLPQSPKI